MVSYTVIPQPRTTLDAGRGRTPPRIPLLAEARRRALSCAAMRFDFSDARKRSAHARVSRDFFWVSYAIVDVLWSDGSPAPHAARRTPAGGRVTATTTAAAKEFLLAASHHPIMRRDIISRSGNPSLR